MVSSNHPNNVPNAISLTNQEVLFREGLLFCFICSGSFQSGKPFMKYYHTSFIICVKTETVLALFFHLSHKYMFLCTAFGKYADLSDVSSEYDNNKNNK